MFKKTIFLTIAIFFLSASIVQAVGVSVVPSKLLIETQVNQFTKTIITVKNPSPVVGIYDVYIDDYEQWIKINPSSFTLESGETKKVELQIKSPGTGVFATQISAVAKPLSSREFQANTGLKIPFEIRVSASNSRLTLSIKQKLIFIWQEVFSLANIVLAIYTLISIMFVIFIVKKIKKAL